MRESDSRGGRLVVMRRSAARREAAVGIALVLPTLALMTLLVGVPIVDAVTLSFKDLYLLRGLTATGFTGLSNYVRFFRDPNCLTYLRNTLVWVLGSVAGELIIGMAVALLLNRQSRARGILRGLILIPWLMPPVVVGVTWKWILDGQWGILNRIVTGAGILRNPIVWLADPRFMWPSIIMVDIWKNMPFAYVNLLAGLQMIPRELYEAAEIDGASKVRAFTSITLPMLKPVISVVVLLLTVWRANEFSLIWVLTQGGPGISSMTLAPLVYSTGFQYYRMSYASAIGVVLMAIMMLFMGIYVKRVRWDI